MDKLIFAKSTVDLLFIDEKDKNLGVRDVGFAMMKEHFKVDYNDLNEATDQFALSHVAAKEGAAAKLEKLIFLRAEQGIPVLTAQGENKKKQAALQAQQATQNSTENKSAQPSTNQSTDQKDSTNANSSGKLSQQEIDQNVLDATRIRIGGNLVEAAKVLLHFHQAVLLDDLFLDKNFMQQQLAVYQHHLRHPAQNGVPSIYVEALWQAHLLRKQVNFLRACFDYSPGLT